MSAARSVSRARTESAEAVAIAHPNVALSKYWGKREGEGNVPAVPSLSVTLSGLTTRTRVRWDATLAEHRFALDGTPRTRAEAPKVFALLDEVRAATQAVAHGANGAIGAQGSADVESHNDFPTASGLASSASGFAALAVAAAGAAGAMLGVTAGAASGAGACWDLARLADVARRGSASAARSLFGGFVEMDGTTVRPVAPVDHMPLAVLVCVTTRAPKAIGSTDGMRRTLATSPYAAAWLEAAPRLHAELRAALLARDFARVGELAEASALAMHASAIAAGVVYWNGATIDALAAVHALRAKGTAAYATIDAGPHVKVLVQPSDVPAVRAAMGGVPGVLRILEAFPGEGAHLEEPS